MRRPELRCSSEAVSFLFVRSVLLLDDSDVMFVLILKDILPIFKNEAKCERMFFELIGDVTAEEIEKRYDKKLQQYVKATSIYPSRQRLLYAYYRLCKKDDKKATECMQKLEKMVDTYMIKADAVHELEVAKSL